MHHLRTGETTYAMCLMTSWGAVYASSGYMSVSLMSSA